jgi:GAF domain-containing protein
MLATSTDLFDQQLVNWFALHGGPWSGTASELLAAIRSGAENGHDSQPDSPRALYSHIETHRRALLALGVDASLHRRHPRMISLRSIHGQRKDQRQGQRGDQEEEQFTSTPTDMSVTGVDSEHFNPARDDGFAFQDTGEALVAIAEIRMQIREQALALEPAIELVVGRAPEITRSCGIAVGLLQQGNLVFLSRTGVAATMGEQHFQTNLFQCCFRTARTLQLRDALNHPRVGATCRREGIGSLIIIPIFHNQEVAGAIEFLFRERRSFSISDVMDLELIAGAISKILNTGEQPQLMEPSAIAESLPATKSVEAVQHIGAQFGDTLDEKMEGKNAENEKKDLDNIPATAFAEPIEAQLSLMGSLEPEAMPDSLPEATTKDSPAPSLAIPPTALRPISRKPWTKWASVIGIRRAQAS